MHKKITYAFRCGDASKYVLFKCAKAAAAATADGWIWGGCEIVGATIVVVVVDASDEGTGGDEESTEAWPKQLNTNMLISKTRSWNIQIHLLSTETTEMESFESCIKLQ